VFWLIVGFLQCKAVEYNELFLAALKVFAVFPAREQSEICSARGCPGICSRSCSPSAAETQKQSIDVLCWRKTDQDPLQKIRMFLFKSSGGIDL
jgi:hypothetical protein